MTTLTRVLTRERLFATFGVTLLFLALSLSAAPDSDANICRNFGLRANCRIVFGGEKSDGNGGGKGSGRPACHRGAPEYKSVPCEDAVAGSWSNARQCYVIEAIEQPGPDHPGYREGAKLYTCTGLNDEGNALIPRDSFWSEEPPETNNPQDLQEDLETAVGTRFRAMYPGLAPSPVPMHARFDGYRMAPVGLNVWMWPRALFDSQWDPPLVEDPDTGYYVDAGVTHVKWEMGDGTSITCGKSEPFSRRKAEQTPDCGHKYKKPGNYLVRITTYWNINYRDANGEGRMQTEFKQSLWIRIGENQVVNK